MGMRRETHVAAPGFFLLDQACLAVTEAYGTHPYLVGSSITTKAYRDVDVRLILHDDDFDRHFPNATAVGNPRFDALWSLVCSAISRHLSAASGLPVDFQIQSQTTSDSKYRGERRVALGLFLTPSGGH